MKKKKEFQNISSKGHEYFQHLKHHKNYEHHTLVL